METFGGAPLTRYLLCSLAPRRGDEWLHGSESLNLFEKSSGGKSLAAREYGKEVPLDCVETVNNNDEDNMDSEEYIPGTPVSQQRVTNKNPDKTQTSIMNDLQIFIAKHKLKANATEELLGISSRLVESFDVTAITKRLETIERKVGIVPTPPSQTIITKTYASTAQQWSQGFLPTPKITTQKPKIPNPPRPIPPKQQTPQPARVQKAAATTDFVTLPTVLVVPKISEPTGEVEGAKLNIKALLEANIRPKALGGNIDRSYKATKELPNLFSNNIPEIYCIQEPYIHAGCTFLPTKWRTIFHPEGSVLVSIRNPNIAAVIRHINKHFVCVDVSKGLDTFSIISFYFPPFSNKNNMFQNLNELTDTIQPNQWFLFGDGNIQSELWVPDKDDSKRNRDFGVPMIDFILCRNLLVWNDSTAGPNFQTNNGRSWIDVTLSTSSLYDYYMATRMKYA
ncbi:hypothetical protein HNY73_012362 [Argiope bruennichi]|uniref:Endonuclease/exonuclease/phosphatase domain-containing protein n=1 Tax=Argiope bruennichi TaxID=94029 RepID=A0A8T0EWR5_ARGBR|nr:hypothetical protein HNY73_012362 [Argiope bruennichi]